VGFVGNGAKRWISIGPITIQPSEIAKITIVMMLAYYFSKFENLALKRKQKGDVFKYGTLIPILIFLVPIILIMLQKHLSCIVIIGVLGLCIVIAAGVHLKYISVFCVSGFLGLLSLALFTDYTKERIMVWQNPEAYKLTGGWQTLQGLMAIGSGGIFGVGFGNSVMKHCYVSEPANDMIFAILCEETGFIGALFILLLFSFLVFRGITVSLKASDVYSRLVAFGISAKMAIQVLLNVAVVTNSVPNTGISLPFFSYGGSSLMMIFFEMGVLLSISRNAKITK
jgi:cell division protein FtsW